MMDFSSENRWGKKKKALAQQEGAAQYEEIAETQTPFYGDNR